MSAAEAMGIHRLVLTQCEHRPLASMSRQLWPRGVVAFVRAHLAGPHSQTTCQQSEFV